MSIMAFDLYTARRHDLLGGVKEIAESYFSVDTATPETAFAWYEKNPDALIVAVNKGRVFGYADFLPLTIEAQTLIERYELKEEDIVPDHILAPNEIHKCNAVYFAGIAVRGRGTSLAARCAAALVAGFADMLQHSYKKSPLKILYANPTTFWGNKLSRRLGFVPVDFRKTKMGGMDLYMSPLQNNRSTALDALHERYKIFIDKTEWRP